MKPGPKPRPWWQRFMEKIDVREPDECWPWLASTRNGYGQFNDGRSPGMVYAHRVALMMVRRVPEDAHVLHHCDNKMCCNPRHMFIGGDQENVLDKIHKGRAAKKLTEELVREIRAYRAEGRPMSWIARRFGVSLTTVQVVINRQTWGWVA